MTITRPDDWHIHFRDGAMMATAVPATANVFGRAIVMPNLQPPVVDAEQAVAYYDRLKGCLADNSQFEPLMTLYLTDQTTPEMIKAAAASGVVKACKLYPANATTNSAHGVTDVAGLNDTFAEMEKQGILLLVHGEVTDHDIDVFDREKEFIERHMVHVVKANPNLKIVFEHITTADAVEFVLESSVNVAATITPQHLMYNRNDLLVGGVKPHNYCLPVLKRNTHQKALQKAVASGSSKFFLGTDSAPHLKSAKESSCGCAGCYSAPAALELYAHIFDQLGCLDKLEGFASHYGADFYGLPRNTDTVTLVNEAWPMPEQVTVGDEPLVPFFAGQIINWKVQ
nr:dihydroorotase [Echinimonas agarilytica]